MQTNSLTLNIINHCCVAFHRKISNNKLILVRADCMILPRIIS